MIMIEKDLPKCWCGKEYDFGRHGVRDGKVFSEYRCESHKHRDAPGVVDAYELMRSVLPAGATSFPWSPRV